MNDFTRAIFRTTTARKITAIFTDGYQGEYTADIITLLITDPTVTMILDSENGNIMYDAEDGFTDLN